MPSSSDIDPAIAEPTGGSGSAGGERSAGRRSTGSTPRRDPLDLDDLEADALDPEALDVAAPTGDGIPVRSSPLATVGRALGRLVANPRRSVPGPDIDPIRRHRIEYREPSIWVWRRIVGTAFAFIVITVAWYLLKVPDGLVSDDTVPTQGQVAAAFNDLRVDGYAGAKLVDHAAASLARLVIGTLIGFGVGGAIGLAMGSAPLARTILDPVTSLLRMVPAVAIGPIAVLWLGAGEAGIVGAVAATVTWTTIDAVATTRIRDLRAVRPDIPHELALGARRALAAGWAAVLAIETLLAPVGLGPMLWTAQREVEIVVAGIYVVGLVGLTVDAVPRAVEYLITVGEPVDRRAVRGRHPAGRSEPPDLRRGFRSGSVVG